MEFDVLKYVLLRCKLVDIFPLLKKWNFIRESDYNEVNFKGKKKDVADKIIQLCKKNKLSLKNACDLHLIYTQLHSTSKHWTVYQLFTGHGEDRTEVQIISRPAQLRKSLQTQMLLYVGDVLINMNYYAGAVWGRIEILDDRTPGYDLNSTIFLVAYPRTPYLMLPRIKVGLLDNVLQAILVAFGADAIKPLKLTGCHVSSLAELAINRHSQESFRNYREREETENPLSRKIKKRKVSDDGGKDCQIVNEEELRKKRKLEDMNDKLGTLEQPVLEKLRYQLNINYRGNTDASLANTKPFKNTVTFEGTSVLEGLRNLAHAGLARWPMPNHVYRVSSLAKNFIVLSEKPTEQSVQSSQTTHDKDMETPCR
ncbi:centromere protein N-like [Gigantopelta aegis]|uniref:centromere protein N-like n=1 Tax=Gigantopelta aegis TaxID=1735272 RepID=UPI001B88DB84|nr:centromere protein N-like [Gigantopelta aegis]